MKVLYFVKSVVLSGNLIFIILTHHYFNANKTLVCKTYYYKTSYMFLFLVHKTFQFSQYIKKIIKYFNSFGYIYSKKN